MGSELVSDSASPWQEGEGAEKPPPPTHTEIFYKYLPYYLSIGMPYDLFWDGDCRLVEAYRRAEELRQRMTNQHLWLQGLYFYEALCDVSPVLRAFAKKGVKPSPYPNEPYPLTKEQKEESDERKERLALEKHKAKMETWAAKINAQMDLRNSKEG